MRTTGIAPGRGMAGKAGRGSLVVAGAALCGLGYLGWTLAHLYSTPSAYAEYLPPTRLFLEASLAADSAKLDALGAAPEAIRWGLETGRRDPALLRILRRELEVAGGMRHQDRAVVFFRAVTLHGCLHWPLTVSFAGPATRPVIEQATTPCDAGGAARH